MNPRRSWFKCMMLLSLAILSGMLASCSDDSSSNSSSSNNESLRIYEMIAEYGNFTAVAGDTTANSFQLSLSNVPEEVLYFTDRPAQEAGFDTVDNVMNNIWPRVYGTVAPNALLKVTTANQEYIELFCILDTPVYNQAAGQLGFRLTYLNGNQKPISNLSFTDAKLIILNNAAASQTEWSELLAGDVGTFEPTATNGIYTLHIQKAIGNVFSYTSAPMRQSTTITVKEYIQGWQSRFGTASPNVSIAYNPSISQVGGVQIVTLSDPVYDENTGSINFTAQLLYGTEPIGASGLIVNGPSLFIDGGKSDVFTVINSTGKTVYVYNFPYLEPEAMQPALTLEDDKSHQLSLVPDKSMRIYFADEKLANSIEQGKAPDVFNYNVDATVTYSFMEYKYEPSDSRYTVDLSYIDEFSYPLTVKFSDVPSTYTGCDADFEYGFTSLATVKENLKQQTDYSWDALIWPYKVKTTWNSENYPLGMDRIIGPNKVWAAQRSGTAHGGPWVPHSYDAFMASLPWDGIQLFTSVSNWNGWQNMTEADNPGPSHTGYAKALQQAAKADKNGKYGFFTYPRDNTSGEFTYVPDSATCTIIIYPYDK
jgi:hypothetical protein